MKLKNKKTGEIGYTAVLQSKAIGVMDENAIQLRSYNSLSELCKEWKDYEEPKGYWYVDDVGVMQIDQVLCSVINMRKSIGNYFETKEEAEKAIERLRAWKRLRDHNVKFNIDFAHNRIDFTYSINNSLLGVLDAEEQIFNNMKIVFGGEE